jgi:hypothetical protein
VGSLCVASLKSLRENSTYELGPAGTCLSFPHQGPFFLVLLGNPEEAAEGLIAKALLL